MKRVAPSTILFFLIGAKLVFSQNITNLAPPIEGNTWVQPAQGKAAQAIWGHKNGLRIGLSPLPGPRGLIRVYTPYLDQKEGRVMNFLAMEPIVQGSETRGFSELEKSQLDSRRGKRFWSANDSLQTHPLNDLYPASGNVKKIDGVETLSLFIFSEEFENGAKVYVRLRFYKDKPFEVEITTYTQPGSNCLDNFIITATMGNFARLRTLYFKDKTIHSHQTWPEYQGDAFTDHARFPAAEFIKDKNKNKYFIAAPDEVTPSMAKYDPSTVSHWKYQGKKAVQYWKIADNETGVEGWVNGRYRYWASKSPIPGGISFENFELKSLFQEGRRIVFGISPLSPKLFIEQITGDMP